MQRAGKVLSKPGHVLYGWGAFYLLVPFPFLRWRNYKLVQIAPVLTLPCDQTWNLPCLSWVSGMSSCNASLSVSPSIIHMLTVTPTHLREKHTSLVSYVTIFSYLSRRATDRHSVGENQINDWHLLFRLYYWIQTYIMFPCCFSNACILLSILLSLRKQTENQERSYIRQSLPIYYSER